MAQALKNHQSALGLTLLTLLGGLGLACAKSGNPESVQLESRDAVPATDTVPAKETAPLKAKDEEKPESKIPLIPPPTDVNELSMEVAALRTLYLLKAGPDQFPEHNSYPGIKLHLKNCAQPPRTRRDAQVSKNYLKLLIDLRAAFITNNEDRIGELSDQLEQLTNEEQPDLDDAIEITEPSKESGPLVFRGYFDANRIAGYIAAYGKDFPEPYALMKKTVRGDLKGSWPTPDVWKETCEFVIKEVSSTIAGFDAKGRAELADKVKKLLDRAYGMSDEKLKKEWSEMGKGLRGEVAAISNWNKQGPTGIIKHVLERDFAELFSNPRLLKAIEAREDYLKKKDAALTAKTP